MANTTTAPRTATEAAGVLLATWNIPGNPTAAPMPEDAADLAQSDPWLVLTRRPTLNIPGLTGRMEQARQRALQSAGVAAGLPPVLVRLPLEFLTVRGAHGWAPLGGDPDPDTLAEDGYPSWAFRVGEPTLPNRRPRSAVVGGDPLYLPAEPFTTHALAVGVLVAQWAADAVRKWAAGLPVSQARRARREADQYDAVADELEAAIPATAGWLDEVEILPTPGLGALPPTVPTVLYGNGRSGVS